MRAILCVFLGIGLMGCSAEEIDYEPWCEKMMVTASDEWQEEDYKAFAKHCLYNNE